MRVANERFECLERRKTYESAAAFSKTHLFLQQDKTTESFVTIGGCPVNLRKPSLCIKCIRAICNYGLFLFIWPGNTIQLWVPQKLSTSALGCRKLHQFIVQISILPGKHCPPPDPRAAPFCLGLPSRPSILYYIPIRLSCCDRKPRVVVETE